MKERRTAIELLRAKEKFADDVVAWAQELGLVTRRRRADQAAPKPKAPKKRAQDAPPAATDT